ncbi:hypothetical protein BDB00DRAFT_823183 [Zychaea mexicana]|uniref:uncharacterized protein n=1 Tax=Zychaea mexicana TaxID=64656 RepID=UPI0022FECD43|nr:uncharacterized protein BDB00DRAFT_823183 [Zychaea mexicana]KAI9493467.1 hypothetical protein BDB00DRAFT_823183 [Zychaea mexicana]
MSANTYQKLATIVDTHTIDELGLVFGLPDANDLPPYSQQFYPLIFVESKLGLPLQHLHDLIREADQAMHEANDAKAVEQSSRIMIALKPENYTAMNIRKQLVESGKVTLKDELQWINLVFTVQKHCKSNVAWHHRQWLFMRPGAKNEIDLDHELQLCARTATLHPRNYYAWNYRRWLLESHMTTQLLREREYKETQIWVEKNVSDHSGVHHLACVIKAISQDPYFDGHKHLSWIDGLITQFPGHEALWSHLRFCCSTFAVSTLGHEVVEIVIQKTVAISEEESEKKLQLQLALCFGIWLCIWEKRHRSNNSLSAERQHKAYTARLHELTPIPKYIKV